MKKKIIIIAIFVLTIALAVAAGFLANALAVSREAVAQFKSELKAVITENEELEEKRKELRSEISGFEKEIESKKEISAEAEEFLEQLNSVKAEVDAANIELTELDESIKKKREYIEQAKEIKKPSRGRTYYLYDGTLKCPDEISAGRYIAEGKGNLLVYSSSDKLRISENLSTIETNSFTFDLEEGESVKATEEIRFTVLK